MRLGFLFCALQVIGLRSSFAPKTHHNHQRTETDAQPPRRRRSMFSHAERPVTREERRDDP
ncbi:hypothetical protein BN2475_250129 [Paraburkholderia ribeironis]|uniref:Uncharacterized protein n=1 Tax=Paraburkholderia ribeironis TaxID=1247936 RepID=A0A1N7S046_9BURK|nr:hypothetical protein BN2475_250129 [Paraburkholderia ribeironis]